MKMDSKNDRVRLDNLLDLARDIDPGFDVNRLIPEENPLSVKKAITPLKEHLGLDHIPRFALVGIGNGSIWGCVRYMDDLSGMLNASLDMHDLCHEIESVVALDLDLAEEARTFSGEGWADFWWNEEDEEDEEDDWDELSEVDWILGATRAGGSLMY